MKSGKSPTSHRKNPGPPLQKHSVHPAGSNRLLSALGLSINSHPKHGSPRAPLPGSTKAGSSGKTGKFDKMASQLESLTAVVIDKLAAAKKLPPQPSKIEQNANYKFLRGRKVDPKALKQEAGKFILQWYRKAKKKKLINKSVRDIQEEMRKLEELLEDNSLDDPIGRVGSIKHVLDLTQIAEKECQTDPIEFFDVITNADNDELMFYKAMRESYQQYKQRKAHPSDL